MWNNRFLSTTALLCCLSIIVCGAQREDCQSCNPEECLKPQGCIAGVVKDLCECCDVCGKAEYELCDHPDISSTRKHGKCGDNLDCRVRKDLDKTRELEAICYCRVQGTLCGSDNVTYDSICQLNGANIVKQSSIVISREGPCDSAPVIVSPPENMKNATGSNIAILCEAKGYPIPTIDWTWLRVDGQTVSLPSDDLHISVNVRGGPEKWQVTGWLQIMDLQKSHEGDYMCVAMNEFGIVRAVARINVIESEDGREGADL